MSAMDAAVELGSLGSTRPYVVENHAMQAVAARDAVAMLVSAETIWLGEHHEAQSDRDMQAGIIAAIAVAKAARTQRQRPCVGVGLEAVRAEFQPALDAYVAGDLGESLDGLRNEAHWDDHWPFPIEAYGSVLDMCRELSLPIVALGASSDELRVVERDGLAALDASAWERLNLPEGPATFAGDFPTYNARAYQSYVATAAPFANQYCGRLLWDESMAARAADWVEAHRDLDPTLVVLAGAEHVTFGCGAPARCARRLDRATGKTAAKSVLLNPKPDDFVIPPANMRGGPLTLGLNFAAAGDDPPRIEVPDSRLSDLIWFSPWAPDCV